MPVSLTNLPATPATQQRLWLHAAVANVAAYLGAAAGPDAVAERFPFLAAYLADAHPHAPDAPPDELGSAWLLAIDAWERRHARPEWPLRRLAAAGLGPPHLLALALAGLVELDARFGALFAALHPAPDEQRLTVGLLDDLLRSTGAAGWPVARLLVESGLLQLHRPELPRAARPLSVPGPVWDACAGERSTVLVPGLRLLAPGAAPTLAELRGLLPDELLARLGRLAPLLDRGEIDGLVLRGMRGSGRLRALAALARARDVGLLLIARPEPARLADQCRLAGPLATLLGAMPALELELAPGENLDLPPFPGYSGPLGVLLGADGGVQGERAERAITMRVPPADRATRAALWHRSLGGAAVPGLVEEAAGLFQLTIGGIERAAPLARAYAAVDGRAIAALPDVQEACRTLNRQSLEALAVPVATAGHSWDALVVADAARAELQGLLLRCRQREAVLPRLGPGFGLTSRGVRALFAGPSGTGKSLAARILVAAMGLDLYRVDLAAVVNKYIGETERNLSRIFARAEEQDVVLLLDEGDSLLTGRTDVRSSNDRYANMETNYLLQRLEQYDGIMLITTNAAGRIDDAFQRRMDVVVEFSPPTPAQRLQIWQLHLPAEHRVDTPFLHAAANRCALSGGQIRNAALHATVLAVEAGAPLSRAMLSEAIAREYRKLGAISPLAYEERHA